MPDGFLDFFFVIFWRFFALFWHFLVVFCHFLPLFSSNFTLGISVPNFRTDMPNVKFVILCQNWPKPWSSMFGGRYLRQRTALGSESTALQTETTLGPPTGQKRRICGKNVINLLIFGFFLTFLAINLQADLCRILGISLVFFTFFFFSKSKTLQTFLLVIFPHFLIGNLQPELCRILGISLVFWGSESNACRTHLPTEKKEKKNKPANRG